MVAYVLRGHVFQCLCWSERGFFLLCFMSFLTHLFFFWISFSFELALAKTSKDLSKLNLIVWAAQSGFCWCFGGFHTDFTPHQAAPWRVLVLPRPGRFESTTQGFSMSTEDQRYDSCQNRQTGFPTFYLLFAWWSQNTPHPSLPQERNNVCGSEGPQCWTAQVKTLL